MFSERFGGFLMEHGPSTFNGAFPAAMDRLADLGLDRSAVDLGPGVRRRYLYDQGELHGISVRRLGFFLSGYLSLGAKLSLATEILRRPKVCAGEESIHEFVTRRFGPEFADRVIEPLAAGIFMGDSKNLSISGAFPKLVEMEKRFGSILRGVLAARAGTEPGRRLLSWPEGIETLPRTLASGLRGKVNNGIAVSDLSHAGSGFAIKTAKTGTLRADAVVLAVQPHVAAHLLDKLDPEAAGALAEIPAPPVGVVFLGYRRDQVSHPLDGLGFLSTKNGRQCISGAQFASTMFERRAPEGHVAISCYVGGSRNPDLAVQPAGVLTDIAHQELSELLGIKGDPVVFRTRHWPRGLPHYTLGHAARCALVETASQRVPGLHLTGNYLSGISVAACLSRATATAEALCRELPEAEPKGFVSPLSQA